MGEFFSEVVFRLGPRCFHDQHRVVEQYSSDYRLEDKMRIERRMKEDSSLRLLICTVAYGLGVDCRDIDKIVVWGAPATTLEFWQLVGRGGRDGRACMASLYAYPTSLAKTADSIKALAEGKSCLRETVMKELAMDTVKWKKVKDCCSVCKRDASNENK